jgi:alkyl hydroperoxide reductase subunit AhpC
MPSNCEVGRNFDEILCVLDALQLNESGFFTTTAARRAGDPAIVSLGIPTDAAKELFPDLDVVKPYLRYTSSTSV